jgi:hypothetical protein
MKTNTLQCFSVQGTEVKNILPLKVNEEYLSNRVHSSVYESE